MTTFEVPLPGLGIQDFDLRLHVFVEARPYRAERSTDMWWECSECGGHVERTRAPALCGECGTAGVIFVPAAIDAASAAESDAESLRAAWLRAGFELCRPTLAVQR
jgi:hypothetical protein